MDQILKYHSWNANGIVGLIDPHMVKMNKMFTNVWKDADLVFIQETKLHPSKVDNVKALAGKFGYEFMFNDSEFGVTPNWMNYGVGLFFKKGLSVTKIEKLPSECPVKNPARIMAIKVDTPLFAKGIYFVNLYLPVNHQPDPSGTRTLERENWVRTLDVLSDKLRDKGAIYVGDFNAMQRNNTLVP
ncbi:DNA-(apurinic or apyrimidinic site) lyase [Folsomia candida]|uniref:DNA-(Apurinic or apyrimidinic site) lyase n=1 Tax=Folsomia candida TaxID=158441 RepID=A0A226EYF4_FOLCA|nr:DNA-(apurinic or apyrimidinic site) lyase [Folsomia candida]